MIAICKATGGQTTLELVSETRMKSVKPNQDGPLDGTSCGTELHDFGFESPFREELKSLPSYGCSQKDFWILPLRRLNNSVSSRKVCNLETVLEDADVTTKRVGH